MEAVVRTLFKRGETHCSNLMLKVEEESRIIADLSRNGYAEILIRIIRQKVKRPKLLQEDTPPQLIPYQKGISESICRIMKLFRYHLEL